MGIDQATVGSLVENFNGAIAVFRHRGIDYYQSRDLPLREVAASLHLDSREVAAELARLPRNEPELASRRDLIHRVEHTYHASHSNALFTALRLSRFLDADQPGFPRGLTAHIASLADLVDTHHEKERETVFSAILRHAGYLRFPVLRAIMEHDEIIDELDTISRLTNDHEAPPDATRPWRRLYALMRRLDNDMRLHIFLEDTLLYSQYSHARTAA